MAAKKKVNWGILSTAKINGAIIPAIKKLPNAELLAVASRDEEKAKQYAEKNGIPVSYGSYRELLENPDIDAVYISLPNGLHHQWIVEALDSGKHVLCEKSIVTSYVDMKELIRIATKKNLLVMEAFMYRYHPFFRTIEQMAKSDKVGKIQNIQVSFAAIPSGPDDIRLNPELGPGVMGDLGCYCLNFCRTLMGEEPASWTSHVRYNETGIDLEARVELLFRADKTAQIFSSFTTYGAFANILGENGRMNIIEPFWSGKGKREFLYFPTESSEPQKIVVDAKEDGYELEVKDFTEAILENRTPAISLEDSLGNVLIMEDVVENGRLV